MLNQSIAGCQHGGPTSAPKHMEVDGIARRHVEDIDRRITQLVALRRELQHSLDACGHGQVGECRVIEALAEQPTVQAVQKS